MKTDKGTWKGGDIEIVKLVYKGKEVTLEEFKRLMKEDEENDKVRT